MVFNNQTKDESLESLRGLAALLVFMHHFFEWNPIIESRIFINSYLMVDFFFVLSGFVIFNAYSEKISSINDFLRFQFLRIGRLYPVHLLFLSIFLIMALVKYIAITQLGVQNFRSSPFGEFGIIDIVLNVFLLQSIVPDATSLNGAAWSISVEFYTYIIFGLIVLLMRHIKDYIFLFFVIVSIALLAENLTFDFSPLLRCIAGFFTGCLTAKFIKENRKQKTENGQILYQYYLSY